MQTMLPLVQVTADLDGCEVGFHHKEVAGVDFVFVDHPSYQRPGGMYGDENGVYGDNQWRFKLLCQAALEAPLALHLPEVDNRRPSLMDYGTVAEPTDSHGTKSNGTGQSASASADSCTNISCIFFKCFFRHLFVSLCCSGIIADCR
jgi:Starch synthase catalytic domain